MKFINIKGKNMNAAQIKSWKISERDETIPEFQESLSGGRRADIQVISRHRLKKVLEVKIEFVDDKPVTLSGAEAEAALKVLQDC
jgi:hypothetical protein